MTQMTVGELKASFSEVLSQVQKGEEVQVLYGRAKKPVARIVPLCEDAPLRKPGILKGRINYTLDEDFKFKSEEEFLGRV